MSKVYVSRNENGIHDALMNGLQWINWKEIIKRDSRVFVKPNFTWPKYRPGVVTSPRLLRELLPILKNRADNVILGESNLPSFNAEEAFSNLGIYKICNESGVEVVNLFKTEWSFFKTRVQNREIKVELPKFLVNEIDVFISVPVMKTHVISRVSLSLKNQWGCIPNQERGLLYHTQLDRMIVAINKILQPKLTIVDALYGLNGRGPIFGDPVKLDLVIVSNDLVAADMTCCKVMQMSKIRHITLANMEGLGEADLQRVEMNAEPESFKKKFKVRRVFFDYLAMLTFKSQSIANLVFASDTSPFVYRLVDIIRPTKEKIAMADDVPLYLKKRKCMSPRIG